jgi:hypothetical protein
MREKEIIRENRSIIREDDRKSYIQEQARSEFVEE